MPLFFPTFIAPKFIEDQAFVVVSVSSTNKYLSERYLITVAVSSVAFTFASWSPFERLPASATFRHSLESSSDNFFRHLSFDASFWPNSTHPDFVPDNHYAHRARPPDNMWCVAPEIQMFTQVPGNKYKAASSYTSINYPDYANKSVA